MKSDRQVEATSKLQILETIAVKDSSRSQALLKATRLPFICYTLVLKQSKDVLEQDIMIPKNKKKYADIEAVNFTSGPPFLASDF